MMRLVVIESPYSGDTALNLRYLRACMADCFKRGEAPYASHGLYTQEGVLDDNIPGERKTGIFAGFEWGQRADLIAFYGDLGVSEGMVEAFDYWVRWNEQRYALDFKVIEFRRLKGWK